MTIYSLINENPLKCEDFSTFVCHTNYGSKNVVRNILYKDSSIGFETGVVELSIIKHSYGSSYAKITLTDEYIEPLNKIQEALISLVIDNKDEFKVPQITTSSWRENIRPVYEYPWDQKSNKYDTSKSPFFILKINESTKFDIFKELNNGVPQWEENASIEKLHNYKLKCKITFWIKSLYQCSAPRVSINIEKNLIKCNVVKMIHKNNTSDVLQYINSKKLTSAYPPSYIE